MPKVDTSFFIARRISSRVAGGRSGVMVRIATVTVCICMAVMIVALAVVFGFKTTIAGKIAGFGGHVEIVNLGGSASFEREPITRNASIEANLSRLTTLRDYYPYAVKGGVIKTDEAMQGIMLKGVDGLYNWDLFCSSLIEGGLPAVGDSIQNKDILISQALARKMKLGVGDRVEMLFINADRPPRRDRFKVSGIYKTGLEENDLVTVVTDLRNVQRLNGWDNSLITGYEVNGDDFDNVENFADDVYRVVLASERPEGEGLMVSSIAERYRNLFDWLAALDVNGVVILTIMILVSLLNMISVLLIILLERTRMIGLLKALGMGNGAIQRIFLIRSSYIVAHGMLWGNIVGIGLCLLQKYTGLVRLNETGYMLSHVPISLGVGWLAVLNIGTFAILLLLLTVPTRVVSRIEPDKTIRYQ